MKNLKTFDMFNESLEVSSDDNDFPMQDCESCGGSGLNADTGDIDTAEECPDCNGTGSVVEEILEAKKTKAKSKTKAKPKAKAKKKPKKKAKKTETDEEESGDRLDPYRVIGVDSSECRTRTESDIRSQLEDAILSNLPHYTKDEVSTIWDRYNKLYKK
jgi:DnaJ-class molecular chaperone